MAGWANLHDLIRSEIGLKNQQHANAEPFYDKLAAAGDDEQAQMAVYEELMRLPPDPALEKNEPNALASIFALAPSVPDLGPLPDAAALQDKFLGAYLGRSAGCALGKPIEAGPYMGGMDGRSGTENVRLWFEGADAWPIENYTPEHSRAEQTHNLFISQACIASTREHIQYMETDDDIRYTILGLHLMEEKGHNWTSYDVGKLWHAKLPYRWVCTAETQAYLNFARVTYHHEASQPADWDKKEQWVRTYLNPMRELIGAQIRVDAYAYAAAGNPRLAAELAWRDASFSHERNGIYGAMFIAAAIAAAFVTPDPDKIVAAGLGVIPAQSRLAKVVNETVELAREATDGYELARALWDKYAHFGPVHAINNTALCVASLLVARGDYTRALATSVLGWDTDCNGATVGSIMGAALGAKHLPAHWTKPLNDTIYSGVIGYHPIAISQCAQRSYQTYLDLQKAR
ncbi:MAG: ADP-ribosylglycohydrolase family protein [Clostridiales bacterium]|nr:ADP-ribosylglycohydrolase family protein [Clostridiales bacterium]